MGASGTGEGARVLRVAWGKDSRVCRVEIEGTGVVRLDADTMLTLRLDEGVLLAPADLEHVRGAAAREEGRVAALRLLQRRFRSRSEIEQALRRRNLPRDVVFAVVAQLRRDGWIDDARFARSWVQDRTALNPRGGRRLLAELRSKGVAPEVAEEAIASLLPRAREEELANAQARVRLRRLKGLPPAVARRRLGGWLQRRGFSGEVITRVLRVLPRRATDHPDVDPAA